MPKPTITSVTVTIPAGQSLSDAANLTTGSLAMILSPPDWTPANISFLISSDNVNFRDLYDSMGAEIIRALKPNAAINVDPSLTTAALYLKLLSGPRQNPVPQEADRVFTLVLTA